MDASSLTELRDYTAGLRTYVSHIHECLTSDITTLLNKIDHLQNNLPLCTGDVSPVPSPRRTSAGRSCDFVPLSMPGYRGSSYVQEPQPVLSRSGDRVLMPTVGSNELPKVQRENLPVACHSIESLTKPVEAESPTLVSPSDKQQVELYFRFLDQQSDRKCKYVYQRGQNLGKQCGMLAVQGSHFCGPCTTKNLDSTKYGPVPQLPVGRKLRLEFRVYDAIDEGSDDEDNENEYYLSEAEVAALTERPTIDADCTITSSDGKKFFVHKDLLTGLGRFYREEFSEAVPLDATATTLQYFIELVYGLTVYLANWREAFELCLFLKTTVDDFDTLRYRFTRAFHVDKKDYGEYVSMLAKLYDNKIPKCVIEFSKRFLD